MTLLKRGLAALSDTQLRGIRRGVEKESLRARPDGTLALTPHPSSTEHAPRWSGRIAMWSGR